MADEQEEEFIVEKIIDKRTRAGISEYYLKWKGYPETESTWEPVNNLDCPELIQEFEDNRKKAGDAKKRKSGVSSPDKDKKRAKGEKQDGVRGFERNLDPEKIIGATDASGELMFLVKW